jgi:hypothetical protein
MAREDRDIGELLKRFIPLAVNNLLVAPHNLQALLHDIQALIHALNITKMPLNIFKMPLLVLEGEEAPPLRVVRGAAEAKALAREVLRSLGTAGRRGSCLESL